MIQNYACLVAKLLEWDLKSKIYSSAHILLVWHTVTIKSICHQPPTYIVDTVTEFKEEIGPLLGRLYGLHLTQV